MYLQALNFFITIPDWKKASPFGPTRGTKKQPAGETKTKLG